MNSFRQIPFLRLLAPLLLGIFISSILSNFIDISVKYLVIVIFTLLLIVGYLNLSFFYRKIHGGVITLLFFLIGFTVHLNYNQDDLQSFADGKNRLYKVEIISDLAQTKKGTKFEVIIHGIVDSVGNIDKAHGKVLVYMNEFTYDSFIKRGDVFIVPMVLFKPFESYIPGTFNYSSYLKNQRVFYQSFIQKEQLHYLGTNFSIFSFAENIRMKCFLLLDKYLKNPRELAVISALTLGKKDGIEQNLSDSYASAGAIHILAVSGLHVGIFFFIFNFLLRPLDKNKKLKVIKAIILCAMLWFYALLTGLSPSVTRATTMFSFVIIGQSFNRNTNIYNTISVSAFFLLLFNPNLLFEVGFQLSYLAVFGIIYLYPKIYRTIHFKLWIVDKIWQISCVSIAAQLATFPIALYYFHQFPTYFLLSNLIVIPLATFIIYFTVLFFMTSLIPFLAELNSYVIENLTYLLNEFVSLVKNVPFSVLDNIPFSPEQLILIYMCFTFLLLMHEWESIKYFKYSLYCLIGILGLFIYNDFNQLNQVKLLSFRITKNVWATELIKGKESIVISNELIDSLHEKYILEPLDIYYGINKRLNVLSTDSFSNNFFELYKGKFQFYGHSFELNNTSKEFNYHILTKKSTGNIQSINQNIIDISKKQFIELDFN